MLALGTGRQLDPAPQQIEAPRQRLTAGYP